MADSSFIWEPTKNVTKKDNGAARWSSLRINPWSDYSQQYRDQLLRWKTPYWDSIKKIPNRSNILIHCQTVKVFFFSKSVMQGAKRVGVAREEKPTVFFFVCPQSHSPFLHSLQPRNLWPLFFNLAKKHGLFCSPKSWVQRCKNLFRNFAVTRLRMLITKSHLLSESTCLFLDCFIEFFFAAKQRLVRKSGKGN